MTPFPTKTALALLLPLAIAAGCGGSGGSSVLPETGSALDIGAANEQPVDNTGGDTDSNGATDSTNNTGSTDNTGSTQDTGSTDDNGNSVDSDSTGNTDSSTDSQSTVDENTDTSVNTDADSDGTDDPAPEPAPAANTVSGRVADGYIQGAIVCVDINENGACDEDEPSATSGEGGAYVLDIPEDAADKPIIADVPETAIDEDTGEAIGKKLTLSTPADRPEFISPITTLVHEELKDNPGLTVDEAEGTVKEELGLSDNPAGLFVDYVASQRNGDDSTGEYRFLHQAARVVATMMDDIQDQVEQAANENGLDFTSDAETRKAMRKLVRKEVRELLPEISLAVAEEIQEHTAEESDVETDTPSPADPLLVDVEKLAERLDKNENRLDFVEKIDAIKERTEASQVAMKDILEQGMYWLEVECDHEEIYEGEEFEPVSVESVEIILDDEGAPAPVDLPSHCFAEYGHVAVEGADNQLVETTFEYDIEAASWVEVDRDDEDDAFGFQLVDGEWIAASDAGPSGPVEFLDDGGAVLESGFGQMLVYATSHTVDNTPVIHHIYRRGGNSEFLELLDRDDLFAEGSSVHHLMVKRKASSHIMFNWAPHDDESDCEQFNGNCNVVDVKDEAGFAPAGSLDEILVQSMHGVNLNGAVHNHYHGRPVDLRLLADEDSLSDDGVPTSGKAVWFMPADETDAIEYFPEPIIEGCQTDELLIDIDADELPDCLQIEPDLDCTEHFFVEKPEGTALIAFDDENIDLDSDGIPELESIENHHCIEAPDFTEQFPDELTFLDDADGNLPDVDGNGVTDEFHAPEPGISKRVLGSARWNIIDIDGVRMIEIGLPLTVRHGTEAEDFVAFLLIEDGGYVRRGAQMRVVDTDDTVMYSEAAFETLQSVAVEYVSE